jgi:glycosyltransferase involved in cell wall biosynthesis
MNKDLCISIIIPSLNEERGIKKTLASLPLGELEQMGYDTEVLVIDGNSQDGTQEIVRASEARLIVEERKGYGRAYKTGFSNARGHIIVTLDADGTYPAELIPFYLTEMISKNLDFITINRFSSVEKGAMSLTHKIGNKILSSALRLLYSISVIDSQSGMWIVRKDLIDMIVLMSDDMALSEEIKVVAFTYFNSIELPGSYSVREGDAKLATLRHGCKNFFYLFKFRARQKDAIRIPKESTTCFRRTYLTSYYITK